MYRQRSGPGSAAHVFRSVFTYFAHDLVVLQDTPADVDTVIVPVCPGHLLIDVGVHARHGDGLSALALCALQVGCSGVGRNGERSGWEEEVQVSAWRSGCQGGGWWPQPRE